MGGTAITPLLETRAHVIGDRDFLFRFLRELSENARRAQESPDDPSADAALWRQLTALRAFVEKRNIQAATGAA
jgi:hypothetical protein